MNLTAQLVIPTAAISYNFLSYQWLNFLETFYFAPMCTVSTVFYLYKAPRPPLSCSRSPLHSRLQYFSTWNTERIEK